MSFYQTLVSDVNHQPVKAWSDRETRNEKRETRNEKRETRNEKQETRNEKWYRSIVRSPLTPISTPICRQISPFLRASLYPAADLSYSTGLAWTSRISLSVQLASMTACRRRWWLRYWTSRWFVNICNQWQKIGRLSDLENRQIFSFWRNKLVKLLIFDWTIFFSFLVFRFSVAVWPDT